MNLSHIFNYYKMAYELEMMSQVNGQKNPVLSQHILWNLPWTMWSAVMEEGKVFSLGIKV